MLQWIQQLRKRFAPPPVRKSRKPRTVLMIEQLEDRITPATWNLTLTTDNGGAGGQQTGQNAGDLRYCVMSAAIGDTINLQQVNGQTIKLNSQIKVTQNDLTINAPNNLANVTISGQNKTRIFEVSGDNDVINNITFTGGDGTDGKGNAGNGGAILVDPSTTLVLNKDTFQNNQTTGANANGGAIENDGDTLIYGCSFSNNQATGAGGAIEI